jgi:Family of unknown function (DUF6522)
MSAVWFEDNGLSVDAAVIGRGLGMSPSAVQANIRAGKLTVLCERGVDEDQGRYRLTFFFENRRFRLVVDEKGNAIQRSTVDFGSREIPRSMRREQRRKPGP